MRYTKLCCLLGLLALIVTGCSSVRPTSNKRAPELDPDQEVSEPRVQPVDSSYNHN